MALEWDPWGVPGVVAGAASMGLGWLVYRAQPRRYQNRVLATLLAVLGCGVGVGGGLRFLFTDAPSAYATYVIFLVANSAAPALLLLLYGTLPTPYAAPLRSPPMRLAMVGLAIASVAAGTFMPSLYATRMTPAGHLDVFIAQGYGPMLHVMIWLLFAAALLGIPLTLSAYRRSVTPLERSKQAWFAGAVIVHSIGTIALLLFAVLVLFRAEPPFTFAQEAINFFAEPATLAAFCVVLALGMLRSQLFDMDLKVKWTVRQSTVAGIVLAAAFVASEAAQQFFQGSVGPYLGIAVAGLLVFAMAPLQRLGERVSDAAMPRVTATPEYVHARKADVFRAALEGALTDGVVTERERDILRRLQMELGIANAEARALEDEVRDALGPRAVPA